MKTLKEKNIQNNKIRKKWTENIKKENKTSQTIK